MRILFHKFRIGDVDEFDLVVRWTIDEWLKTSQGQWVVQHANNIQYFTGRNVVDMCRQVDIVGELADGPLITEYALRWKIKQY